MKKLQATLGVAAIMAASFAAVNQTPPSQEQNALDWISTSPNHTILSGLITDSGMTDTLRGVGPYTVFAPTDEAFRKLPEGKVDELRGDTVKLKGILEYHVASGRYGAADLQPLDKLATLKSEKAGPAMLKLKWENSMLLVNDAKVTLQDTWVSNGVVHSIDTVLMPAPTR